MHKSVIGTGSFDSWEGLGENSTQSKHSLQRYVPRKTGAALFSKLIKDFKIFPLCRNGSRIRPKLDSIVGGLDPPIPWGDFRRKIL